MSRYAAFVLCFSFGLVFHLSHGTEVNVTDGEKLCLYANLMLNFSVSYDVAGNKSQTVVIELPDAVKSDGSKCGANSSTLKLDFGEGHSWSVSFSSSGKSYQADVVTFSYNLSDTSFFPDSLSNETLTVTSKADFSVVSLDTCYSCNSKDQIKADRVNMTLWNVLIQAFIVNGSRSDNKTICPADTPTTAAPTTTVPTTPVTNATTAAPITNATTVAPTTPTPTLPPPSTGNYTVKLHSDQNTTCLLANFGLRIGFKIKEKYQEMNFDPVGAGVSGSCDLDSSELVLERDQMNVTFTFKNDTKKFFLHALNVSLTTSSGAFIGSSTNLSLWEASIGSSYMCNKEQNFTISDQLSLFTFSLHVQPFGVKKGVFSTAHECSLDDPSILIPIIVGAALAGLILIVVVAYVIGRRKTYAGYQTL